MIPLWSGGPRARLTLALLRLHDAEIVRYLGDALALMRDPEQYDRACRQRLEAGVRRCREVPFYAERFARAGLFEGGRFHADRLRAVPPLTKHDIRAHFAALQHPGERVDRFENTSGGSTGEPVRLIQDARFYARSVADTILFGLLNGKRPGDREVKLWGSERDILEGTIGWREKLINLLYNRILLNSFVMDAATMRSYIDRINRARPVQIWAYIDSILELARFAAREGRPLHNPRVVVCTAGTMYPDMRAELEAAFPRSRIVNQYGSREVGQIACEIEGHAGLWLLRHSNHIELIDADTGEPIEEPGRPGRVLVTTLNNDSMPLVRFDIGDIAEFGPPSEGFHTFARLHGRENTHLVTPDGARVHGEFFTHLFYGRPWAEQFQVIQTAPDHVEVHYVANGHLASPDELAAIRADMRRVLGSGTEVLFEERARLERLGSGKYQFVRREFA